MGVTSCHNDMGCNDVDYVDTKQGQWYCNFYERDDIDEFGQERQLLLKNICCEKDSVNFARAQLQADKPSQSFYPDCSH